MDDSTTDWKVIICLVILMALTIYQGTRLRLLENRCNAMVEVIDDQTSALEHIHTILTQIDAINQSQNESIDMITKIYKSK